MSTSTITAVTAVTLDDGTVIDWSGIDADLTVGQRVAAAARDAGLTIGTIANVVWPVAVDAGLVKRANDAGTTSTGSVSAMLKAAGRTGNAPTKGKRTAPVSLIGNAEKVAEQNEARLQAARDRVDAADGVVATTQAVLEGLRSKTAATRGKARKAAIDAETARIEAIIEAAVAERDALHTDDGGEAFLEAHEDRTSAALDAAHAEYNDAVKARDELAKGIEAQVAADAKAAAKSIGKEALLAALAALDADEADEDLGEDLDA